VGTVGANVGVATSSTITALDPQAYGTTWALGFITTTDWNAADLNDAPATWGGFAYAQGTGNSTVLNLALATEYQLFLRIPGYYSPIGPVATINTATQASVAINLEPDRDNTNALLWPQTSTHTTQAARFSYNSSTDFIEYTNTTGATDYIAFLAAYRALETITKDPATAYDYVQPLYINGSRNGFYVPRSAPLFATMNYASDAAAILQADLSYPDNQQPAYDRLIPTTPYLYMLTVQPTASVSQYTIDTIRQGLALEASVQTSIALSA
jgi:hypothetical protein